MREMVESLARKKQAAMRLNESRDGEYRSAMNQLDKAAQKKFGDVSWTQVGSGKGIRGQLNQQFTDTQDRITIGYKGGYARRDGSFESGFFLVGVGSKDEVFKFEVNADALASLQGIKKALGDAVAFINKI